MFRPIKNFITYIQKNASSSSIFGGNETKVMEKLPLPDKAESESEVFDKESPKETTEFQTSTKIMDTTAIMDPSFFATDLEQHIKSCVIPLKNGKILESLPKDSHHDHNQNHAKLFERDGNDDLCSVDSDERVEEPELTEKFATEEEDEEPFHDVPQDIEGQFPGPEIIVVNDDLNSSIASETPSEDPLAIDEFSASTSKHSICMLDSVTNDEASTNSELLWLNLDEFKTNDSLEEDAGKDQTDLSLGESERPTEIDGKSNDIQFEKGAPNEEHGEELRSEGSDSGLGSETSILQTTINSLADTSQIAVVSTPPAPSKAQKDEKLVVPSVSTEKMKPICVPTDLLARKPIRSNLKRRLDDSLDSSTAPTESESVPQQKKPKRSINFDTVQVYYFPRQQGFGCVPSAGGCTLGMSSQHVAFKKLTLAEHAAEIRRAHRLQLQEINPRGSSSDDSEESEEDYLSEGSGSDLDADMNGFLQPVSPKQRRALLKAAGVRKIDASEKAECRDIRNSREICGCSCRDFCDPETCSCSQAGIKCQVDRAMFPCGCSRDACGNTVGRIEFNPTRVRTHYIHTIMRLEMENRQQQNPTICNSVNYSSSSTSSAPSAINQPTSLGLTNQNYYSMQSQSNYSSGYASPAYSCEQTANYYQQQPSGAHYGSLPTPELVQTSQYSMDSLDSGLFSGAPSATPAYGEIMPNYSVSASAYHNLSYSNISSGMHAPQISSYSSYGHQSSATNFLPQTHSSLPSTYSSCAVPSAPPFGTATTTAATPLYQHHGSETLSLDSTAPICAALAVENANNFISLSTPIASSSRLSQINDLLQHNRNTTAALVSIGPPVDSLNGDDNCDTTTTLDSSSIDTPPIQDAQKSCLAFNDVPSAPLTPLPIVAVIESGAIAKSLQAEPPPDFAKGIEENYGSNDISTEVMSTSLVTTPTTPTSLSVTDN